MEMHLLWGDYRSGDMGESIHPKKIKILKDSEEKKPIVSSSPPCLERCKIYFFKTGRIVQHREEGPLVLTLP